MVELDRAVRLPIIDQESEGFTPSLTMRPHHFFLPFVRDSLQRKRNSKEVKLVNGRVNYVNVFVPKHNKFFPYPIDQRNYFEDVYGKTEADREKYKTAKEDYLTALWKLPNQSFIHLDLQPDGVCKACIGGKHCTAFYVRGQQIDPFNGERIKLIDIESKLKNAGYKLGEDFICKKTSNILYDYDHRSLGTRKPVTPETVIFDSLIVRTGALRRI